MPWQDIWEKWWPRKELAPGLEPESGRERLPLTSRQRQLTAYLVILVVVAALMLQFTGNKSLTSPVAAVRETKGQIVAEPVQGKSSNYDRSFQEEIEQSLARLLGRMEGVGGAEVMVSTIVGPRLELAHDANSEKTTTEETDQQGGQRRVVAQRLNEKVVIVREGQGSADRPIVLAEHRPTIGGILVVADGAKNPGIKLRIARAVAIACDIPAHRVMVVARKE